MKWILGPGFGMWRMVFIAIMIVNALAFALHYNFVSDEFAARGRNGYAVLWAMSCVLSAGVVGYWIREGWRAFFGVIEVISAVLLAYVGVRQTQFMVGAELSNLVPADTLGSQTVFIYTSAAAIYLLVRGLDNVNVGLNDKQRQA